MTELEKIKYTKNFIDKLANGINPLDDTQIPDDDLINNVRISRCMFYVSDILGKIIDNNGFTKNKSGNDKAPFCLNHEQLKQLQISQEPIGISELARRINSLIDENTMKKLKVTSLTEWLVDVDLLYSELRSDGKRKKRATSKGISLGITEHIYEGQYGEYKKLLYNQAAQQFIIDNIESVIQKNNS